MEINIDKELQEKIDLYLEGSLCYRDIQKLENRLKQDPTLASEVQKLKEARSVIKDFANRNKTRFTQFIEVDIPDKTRSNYFTYLIRIILGIALIILAIVSYQLSTLKSEDLYRAHYERYQTKISPDNDESINDPIVYNYSNYNYSDVIQIYESKQLNYNKANFLAGCAYLELSKEDEAIECFYAILTEAQKGKSDEFLEEADYYLALAYLKADRLDEANWFLSKIYHDSDHLYHYKIDRIFHWKLRVLKLRNKL